MTDQYESIRATLKIKPIYPPTPTVQNQSEMKNLYEILGVLRHAREVAMEWTGKARIPECAKFAEIAQDLDFVLELVDSMLETNIRQDGQETVHQQQGKDVEAVLRQFLSGDGFISVYDIPHIVAALTTQLPSPEPVSKTDWNNELSSWSDEDFILILHERPDLANRLRKIIAEPVKCVGCEGKPAPENNPCAVCVKEAEYKKLRAERDALARENEAMKRCATKYLEWLEITHMPLDQALRDDMHNPNMCGDAAISKENK